MSGRREKEMKQRKADMIQAARQLFIEKGFEKVGMNEVALTAEMTRRTLYSYFRSKLDLIVEVFLQVWLEAENRFKAVLETSTAPEEKVRRFSLEYYNFFRETPEYYRLLQYFDIAIHSDRDQISPAVRSDLENTDFQISRLLQSVLESGMIDGTFKADLKPELAVSFFTKAWFGVIHQYLFHPQFPEDYLQEELKYLISGLLQR